MPLPPIPQQLSWPFPGAGVEQPGWSGSGLHACLGCKPWGETASHPGTRRHRPQLKAQGRGAPQSSPLLPCDPLNLLQLQPWPRQGPSQPREQEVPAWERHWATAALRRGQRHALAARLQS